MRPRHCSCGFSVIELLIVLALIAFAFAAAMALFGPTRESARGTAFVRDVESMVANIRAEYAPHSSYAPGPAELTLTTASAIARGLIPQHLAASAFAGRDVWGRTFALTRWPTTGAAQVLNSQFAFTFTRPGSDACVPVAIGLLDLVPAEFRVTAPVAAEIVTDTVRPTPAAVPGMAQTACNGTSAVGSGTWQIIFE